MSPPAQIVIVVWLFLRRLCPQAGRYVEKQRVRISRFGQMNLLTGISVVPSIPLAARGRSRPRPSCGRSAAIVQGGLAQSDGRLAASTGLADSPEGVVGRPEGTTECPSKWRRVALVLLDKRGGGLVKSLRKWGKHIVLAAPSTGVGGCVSSETHPVSTLTTSAPQGGSK